MCGSALRVVGDQALERGLGAERGSSIAQEAMLMVRCENQAVDLESHLPGIGTRAEMARLDRTAHDLRQGAPQLALAGEHPVAHRPGAIVVFRGGGENGAAAGN